MGSAIDSYILMPLLFPQDPIKGHRLDDLQITVASEGSARRWALGPKVRVGATVIWIGPGDSGEPGWKTITKLVPVGGGGPGGKGGAGQKAEDYTYLVDFAVEWNDIEGLGGNVRILKILADSKVIYDFLEGDSDYYEQLTHYDGTQTEPDPYMESVDGPHPAYMERAYSVFKNFVGNEFGRIPKLEAIIVQDQDLAVQDAIVLIGERVGYQAAQLSVARVNGCVLGYLVSGVQAGTDLISPVNAAYSITVQEVGDQIVFISRGFEDTITIPYEQIGARQPDENPLPVLDFKDDADFRMPSEVRVGYSDVDADLLAGEQPFHMWDVEQPNVVSMDLPLSLRGEDALNIAKRVAWGSQAERTPIEFFLPPRYQHIREGDVLVTTDEDGLEHRVLARTVRRGADWRIQVIGTTYDPDIYEQSSILDPLEGLTSSLYKAPATTLLLLDIPATNNDHVEAVGLLGAVYATDPDAAWRGAAIFSSPDDLTYTQIMPMPSQAAVGVTYSALHPTAPWHYFDRISELTVEMTHGALQSVTEAQCVAGANRAAVRTLSGDWEIIGFVNAEEISDGVYRLTNLLRGRRGTEHLMGDHAPGQPFVFGDLALRFLDLGIEKFASNDYYKAPATQGLLSAYEARQVRATAVTMRPFSPQPFQGQWDVTQTLGFRDFHLSWKRRHRYLLPPFVQHNTRLGMLAPDEEPETYELNIYFARGTVLLLRSVTLTGAVDQVNTITAHATTPATAGSFTLTVDFETTAAIDFDATAAEVQAALEALPNVEAGDVTCVQTAGADLGAAGAVVTINWTGARAARPVDLTADFTGISSGSDHTLALPVEGVSITSYVYTAEDQEADALAAGGVSMEPGRTPFTVTVAQVSQVYGAGVPNERFFVPELT